MGYRHIQKYTSTLDMQSGHRRPCRSLHSPRTRARTTCRHMSSPGSAGWPSVQSLPTPRFTQCRHPTTITRKAERRGDRSSATITRGKATPEQTVPTHDRKRGSYLPLPLECGDFHGGGTVMGSGRINIADTARATFCSRLDVKVPCNIITHPYVSSVTKTL